MVFEDAPITLRPIEEADLETLAEFVNMCWRVSYADILDAGYLSRLTTQTRLENLRAKWARGVRGHLVLGLEDALWGVLMWGPTHLHATENAGEITMIYLAPGHTGTGLGRRLLRVAEAALIEDGYSNVELDVFQGNHGAVRFYHDNGYAKVGTKQDNFEGRIYELDIMAKPLSSS